MRILLVAEEAAGLRIMNDLLLSPHQLVAVMSSEPAADPSGSIVWRRARESGCATWPSRMVKEKELAVRIREEKIDLLLNVHSLFRIHEAVVAAPRLGAYNLHPGPLPEFAGLNAPSWALYFGEAKHATTLHRMEPEIDTGAVILQDRFDLSDADTGLSVAARCARSYSPLVRALLNMVEGNSGGVLAAPQDRSRWRYFGAEVPQNGVIDWERSARDVFNFVRACDYSPFPSPWGRPRTKCGALDVAIARTVLTGASTRGAVPGTIVHASDGGVHVACGDEWLGVRSVLIGGASVTPADYMPAHRVHHPDEVRDPFALEHGSRLSPG